MTYDIEVPDAVFQRIDDEEIQWLIIPENREMQCLDQLLIISELEKDDEFKAAVHCQIDHITWQHPQVNEGYAILSISKTDADD